LNEKKYFKKDDLISILDKKLKTEELVLQKEASKLIS
jgi:hypothetical protein